MARLNSKIHESLTDDVVKKLFARKIYTVVDFLDTETKILSEVTSIPFREVIRVQKKILKEHAAKVITGDEYYDYLMQNIALVSSGIKNLDDLVEGGFHSGNIVEFYGSCAAGKTQICLTMAVNISQNYNLHIYYIDTKQDFSFKKINSILKARNKKEDESKVILDNITVYKVFTHYEAMSALHKIKNSLETNPKNVVIMIDSLPAIFYQTGNFTDILPFMNEFTNTLQYIAAELNACVFVVNLLLTSIADSVSKPSLGKYWEIIPNMRLLLEKKNEIVTISIAKSNTMPHNSCTVKITDQGVL